MPSTGSGNAAVVWKIDLRPCCSRSMRRSCLYALASLGDFRQVKPRSFRAVLDNLCVTHGRSADHDPSWLITFPAFQIIVTEQADVIRLLDLHQPPRPGSLRRFQHVHALVLHLAFFRNGFGNKRLAYPGRFQARIAGQQCEREYDAMTRPPRPSGRCCHAPLKACQPSHAPQTGHAHKRASRSQAAPAPMPLLWPVTSCQHPAELLPLRQQLLQPVRVMPIIVP